MESQRTVRAGRDVREALKRNGAMRMPRLAETTGAMAQANRLHSGKMPEGRHFGV